MTLLLLACATPRTPAATPAVETEVSAPRGGPTGAGISCSAGDVAVRFDEASAELSRGDEVTTHGGLAWAWDGHLTGTATAEGFRFSYESHYGCVRRASLQVGDEGWDFFDCLGGGTDDRLCYE